MASSSHSKSDHATKSFKLRSFDIAEEPLKMLLPITGFEQIDLVSLKKAVEPLTSILPKVQDHCWLALQNCEEPADELTQDESAAIVLYTMEWEPRAECLYVVLNATLRSKKRTESMLKPWFLYLKLIFTALIKLPSKHYTLYRGVKLNLSEQYPIGKKIAWWGFTSCTTHVHIIEQFLGNDGDRTMFIIDCSTGRDIRDHSFFETENEIVIPPGRYFEVIGTLKPAPNFHIVQLREIQPEVSLLPILPPSEDMIIDLSNNHLTDDDLRSILLPKLRDLLCNQLKLNQNHITDTGVRYLVDIIRLHTVTRIDF